jgi:hypothetical protein
MRRCAALLLTGALALPLVAGPALAAEDPTTGYWTRLRAGLPVPVTPPDPVPEGGSWVSADPSGPVSVSAVRAGADPGSLVVGLRLPVADAVGPPAVIVCPTTDRWVPEQGGRLEAAPPADCSAPVETRVEEDVLVVDLPPELQADVVDLLLSPAEGSAFSLTLERAAAEAVVQAPEQGGSPDQQELAPPPAVLGPPTGFDPGPAFDTGISSPPLDLGAPLPAAEPLLPGPALPEPDAAGPPPQAAPPAAPVELAAAPPVVVDDRSVALLATALLTMLGVLAVRLALQPAAAPRRLGGAARLTRPEVAADPVIDSPQRGVGRFRAVRHRPPVQI